MSARRCSCCLLLLLGIVTQFLTGASLTLADPGGVQLEIISPLRLTPSNPASDQVVTAEFSVRNTGTQTASLNRLGIGGRGPGCSDWGCQNYQDFPFRQQVTIAPGQTYAYRGQRLFLEEGGYFFQVSYESPPGAWFFLGAQINLTVAAGLQLASPLSLTPANPRGNELVFAEFSLRNASSGTLTLARVGVGARGPGCPAGDWGCPKNVDFGYERDVTLQPGEVRRFKSWRLFTTPGEYFAQISIADQLQQWHHLGALITFQGLSASYPPRQSDWQLGVNFHPSWNQAQDNYRLALAKATGFKVVRLGVSWRLLEPERRDGWDYAWYIPAFEHLVERAHALGMRVFVLFLQVPCWASSDPTKNCSAGKWNDAYPPQSNADYARAFRKVVELYGDRVDAWEVWNEPNIDRFWQPAPDPVAYTRLLVAAYQAIKAQDSDAIVLGGALAGADTEFLDRMYEAGAQPYFDALALHPYSIPRSPSDCSDSRWAYACGIDAIRSMMQHHDDPKDIWITEFGWSSYSGSGGVSEDAQKAYLQESLALLERWDFVPVATWYTLNDTDYVLPPEREHENYMGLYDRTNRAKPAAAWLRSIRPPDKIYLPYLTLSGPSAGRVRFFINAGPEYDPYTLHASDETRAWVRAHYWRMIVFPPYFDPHTTWYPDAWAYKGLYAIYTNHGEWDRHEHPEAWFLHDAGGNRLFNKFDCPDPKPNPNAPCAMWAADIGNSEFRAHWIAEARATLAHGYCGLYLDYVNMTLEEITDGNGRVTAPIDPRTGRPMTTAAWQQYMAEFTEAIHAAFPDKEIVHNVLWWYGSPASNTAISRQVRAADFVALQRGINDIGLRWGSVFGDFLRFSDAVHDQGRNILFQVDPMDDSSKLVTGPNEREYDLAGWLLISNGRDGYFGYLSSMPDDWWRGYQLDLGAALGPRYTWSGQVLRRDFRCGMVLVNPPSAPDRVIALPGTYTTMDGRSVSTIELTAANPAAILLKSCATLGSMGR